MQTFRNDNTEGYTDEQLAALNALWAGWYGHMDPCSDGKHAQERLLSAYDAGEITDRIRTLKSEAASAGDPEQFEVCNYALRGNTEALEECARVLSNAEAQQDDEY